MCDLGLDERLSTKVLNMGNLECFVIETHLLLIRQLIIVKTHLPLLFGDQFGRVIGLELPGGNTSLVHLWCSPTVSAIESLAVLLVTLT
jgi:hypothetical protein